MYLTAEMEARTFQGKEIGWPSSFLQEQITMFGLGINQVFGTQIRCYRHPQIKRPGDNIPRPSQVTYELLFS